jgi:hypothetical protein
MSLPKEVSVSPIWARCLPSSILIADILRILRLKPEIYHAMPKAELFCPRAGRYCPLVNQTKKCNQQTTDDSGRDHPESGWQRNDIERNCGGEQSDRKIINIEWIMCPGKFALLSMLPPGRPLFPRT